MATTCDLPVAQLSVLRRALTGSVVAFSADDFEESEEDSWSVLVVGGEGRRRRRPWPSLRALLAFMQRSSERDSS